MPSTTHSRRARSVPAAEAGFDRPAPGEVLIRMYGQGVGDCFLLRLPRDPAAKDPRPFSILVDCGVIGGTPGGADRMRQIVSDVKAQTLDPSIPDGAGNPKGHLDLLVITHEHWDHLSGFVQAEQQWKQIQVDALWTAWTEKEDDDDFPRVLKQILAKQRQALAAAADRAFRLGLSEQYELLLGLMGFYSDGMSEGQGFAVARGVSDAFRIAKCLVPSNRHVCCEPGEIRPLPGTGAVAYVLGPPRDDARLRQMDPARGSQATYEDGQPAPQGQDEGSAFRGSPFRLQAMIEGRSPFNAFALPLVGPILAAPPAGSPSSDGAPPATSEQLTQREAVERSFPFEAPVRVPLPIAERDAAAHPALAAYFELVSSWRRIDADWLGASAEFALRADALTNNTSLVLAFELPAKEEGAERSVLLFAGDAQVGNWLSWDEIKAWQPVGGAVAAQPADKPSIDDLLKRTVFYKVGHHGSHNGTLKAKGVERMRTDSRLTAFVPVSSAVAHEIKGWGRMPLEALLNALAARAVGRVVLQNGSIWPKGPDDGAEGRQKIGLRVADAKLPAVSKNQATIEAGPPLWVEIAISY